MDVLNKTRSRLESLLSSELTFWTLVTGGDSSGTAWCIKTRPAAECSKSSVRHRHGRKDGAELDRVWTKREEEDLVLFGFFWGIVHPCHCMFA